MYKCAFLGLKESAASTPDLSSCGWYSKRFMMVRQVVGASSCLAGLSGRATTSRSCSSMELHQFLTLVLLCNHQSLSTASMHAETTCAKLPQEQDLAAHATGVLCTVQIAQYRLHSTDRSANTHSKAKRNTGYASSLQKPNMPHPALSLVQHSSAP